MASTIKVDNVQNQPGTNVVNKCGTTVNIGAASDNIRSAGNNLQASDGGNLISQSGTTVTLGASGDTVSLASGASQSGFGRAGSVDWDTASIKTATFTAVSGNGYFCNTTGGVFNITLPTSPTAGDIVALKDYLGTFATNNLTIDRGGSKLDGNAANKAITANYTSLTLVYVDGTQGWVPTEEGTGFVGELPLYVLASGGNSTCTVGDYKIHTFTSPGALCVSAAGNGSGSNTVDYMVVAGGGGAGGGIGGGGAAGGYRESVPSPAVWTASPIANPGGALPVTVSPYTITVGGGGTGTCAPGGSVMPSPTGATASTPGANSVFSTITSAGGGYGRHYASQPSPTLGGPGGSGGGGSGNLAGAGGPGNDPATPIAQGFDGGDGNPLNPWGSGGGGGATALGSDWTPTQSGPGGTGATSTINNTPTGRAGGGGGGGPNYGNPCGGCGVDGGGNGQDGPGTAGSNATINTGGGGGGGAQSGPGQQSGYNGGSGIVIIRYKFQ